MLTEQILQQMWPSHNPQVRALVTAIAAGAPAVFAKYHLDSDLVIAHAMAQFTVECGSGGEMTENINYTPERACEVWDTRFSNPSDCLHKVGSSRGDPDFPTKLMDNVYGGRNGNTQPRDGSSYIGRGLSQVTGRGNYEALATKLNNGLNLVSNPNLVNVTSNALECGVADFVLCNCLTFAQADDIIEVSQRLNGGFVGFADRTTWLVKWKQALGVSPARSGTMLWVQQSLNTLGASPQLVADSEYGPGSKIALKEFQAAHRLKTQNGFPTRETIAAIEAALPSV